MMVGGEEKLLTFLTFFKIKFLVNQYFWEKWLAFFYMDSGLMFKIKIELAAVISAYNGEKGVNF